MTFGPFAMERYQSTYEHEVRFNLSESGVEPLTLGELLEITGVTPEALADTLIEYNPSNGSPQLRERIAAMYPGAAAHNVLVTNGGAEANFLVSWRLFPEMRGIVYVAPNYMQVPGLAANFGCDAKPWRLRENAGWQPDPDELDELVTEDTGLILLTNPNNPTGSILSTEGMDAVVAAAARVGAWIVADEIYRGAELDDPPCPSFWGRYDRVLITSGLSKAYGLPGLRLGWTVAPEEFVESLWARKDYTSISMTSLSDRLATAVLEPSTRVRIQQRTRRILRDNWPLMEAWLQARPDAFRYVAPRAGAIVYARYDLPIGSFELAERLRREVDCLIVPGEHFDMPDYLRLGFGADAERLSQALALCASVIDKLRAAA